MIDAVSSPLNAPVRVTVRLAECALPAQIYDWMRVVAGTPPEPSLYNRPTSSDRQSFSPDFLRTLLARGEPLIDLATATYADDHDILLELWARDDRALRLAIAENRYRLGFVGLDLMDVLCSDDKELISVTLENPSMSSPALALVLTREKPLDQLTDEQWLVAASTIARSPVIRLKRSFKDLFEVDGWNSIQREEVFRAAWRLPHHLEPTKANATLLERLLGATAYFAIPLTDYGYDLASKSKGHDRMREVDEAAALFVQTMFQKWRRENMPGGATPLGKFEPDYHSGVRTVIAAAAAKRGRFDELCSSEDLSVRLGYYREGQKWTPEAIRTAYERDGKDFLMEAVGNAAFHAHLELRVAVKACIDSYGQDGDSSHTGFEVRQNLKKWWHDRGLVLWRTDRLQYPHPGRDQDAKDETPFDQLDLTTAIQRIRSEATASFALSAHIIEDAKEDSGFDRVRATRLGLDAVRTSSEYIFAALARLGRELQAIREAEVKVSTIEKVVGGSRMTMASGAIFGAMLAVAVLRWF